MNDKKVVLIENNPDHAELIAEFLGEGDAGDNIILLKDGMDILKFLKKNSRYNKIPAIIFSTASDKETIDEAYKNGANGYFVKPVDQKDFIEKMKILLNPAGHISFFVSFLLLLLLYLVCESLWLNISFFLLTAFCQFVKSVSSLSRFLSHHLS